MEIRTEIVIEAAPERVWHVLTDFASYPDWNPFIPLIQGPLLPGQKLKVEIHPPGGRPMTFRPTLLKLEPNQELRWLGHLLLPGVFDGEHFFRLEHVDEHHTRLVHGENFSGFLLKLMNVPVTRAARGFVTMNSALRSRVLQGSDSGR